MPYWSVVCLSSLCLACRPKAAKKMTTVRAFQAKADLSEEELVDAVAKSSKSAAVGVVKVREHAEARGAL